MPGRRSLPGSVFPGGAWEHVVLAAAAEDFQLPAALPGRVGIALRHDEQLHFSPAWTDAGVGGTHRRSPEEMEKRGLVIDRPRPPDLRQRRREDGDGGVAPDREEATRA